MFHGLCAISVSIKFQVSFKRNCVFSHQGNSSFGSCTIFEAHITDPECDRNTHLNLWAACSHTRAHGFTILSRIFQRKKTDCFYSLTFFSVFSLRAFDSDVRRSYNQIFKAMEIVRYEMH